MKVLHVNSNFIYTKLHKLLIDHLKQCDIVNVVFVPVKHSESYHSQEDNIIVKACFNNMDRLFFSVKQRKIVSCLKKTVDMTDVDIIHAYTLFTDGNVARLLSKTYSIPYVVAVRNTDVNVFFKKRVLLRKLGVLILKDASKVFFLSEAYKEFVINNYVPNKLKTLIESKSVIITNGIDDFWIQNRYYKRREINKQLIRIVYAGSIDKNKNIISTIKALKLLEDKYNFVYTIVGKVVDKRIYTKIIRERMVNYIPQKSKEDLITIYRNNDIFVMPSIHESFGLVYAEAMSQGLPVLYTKGQGFDKQFNEGIVGYHVEAMSPDSIAEGIEKVLSKYDILSANAVKNADKFNWGDISRKYGTVYKDIL